MGKPIKFICKDNKNKPFTKHQFRKEDILTASMNMVKGDVTFKLKCVRCGVEMNIADIKDGIDDSKIKGLIEKLLDLGLKI